MLLVIYLVKIILMNVLDSKVHKRVPFFYRVKNRLEQSSRFFLCQKFSLAPRTRTFTLITEVKDYDVKY